MNGPKEFGPDIAHGLPALLPRLWRLGMSLSGKRDVADDLVQSTCRRAMERAHQFKPGTRLDSWVFTILVSIWRNECRSALLRKGETLISVSDGLQWICENDPETAFYHKQIVMAVGQLPEAQRETVMLVYVEGFSYTEAAVVLDIPIGTVMSRLAKARERLADFLGEAGSKRKKATSE